MPRSRRATPPPSTIKHIIFRRDWAKIVLACASVITAIGSATATVVWALARAGVLG